MVICGIEFHICVMQTSLEIAERGGRPFVVADAIGSRNCIDKRTAISRLKDEKVGIVSTEMALFEWLNREDNPAFREILLLIKDG